MSHVLLAVCCGVGAIISYELGYTNGRADALADTGKAFCEALGKVVESTNELLRTIKKLLP